MVKAIRIVHHDANIIINALNGSATQPENKASVRMYVENDYESVLSTNVWKGDQRFLFNNAGSKGTRGSNRGIHWLDHVQNC